MKSIYSKIVARLEFAMLASGLSASALLAQVDTKRQPYAALDPAKISYQGPGREAGSDIQDATIKIGLILPIAGANAPEGKRLLQAAQIAVDEQNRSGPPVSGRKFAVAVQNESEQWGQVSNAIVQLITREEVTALITSTEGKIAHQAEQIANRLSVPVLTLASDPTTTRVNVPWIFRVGPSDADQAGVMLRSMVKTGRSQKVILITESDHDGRIGGDEFVKAARESGVQISERINIDAKTFAPAGLQVAIETEEPDAVVVWTGSELARQVLATLPESDASLSVYLSQKAAGFLEADKTLVSAATFTVGNAQSQEAEFRAAYKEKTGADPCIVAEQIYAATQTVLRSLQAVGPNRVRLRDYLSGGLPLGGIPPVQRGVSFDSAGNSLMEFNLIRLQYPSTTANAVARK